MGNSAKVTSPLLARKAPVTTLNKVVLPAPFGPITPMMQLCGMLIETFESAVTPPNILETFFSSSSGCDTIALKRRSGER
jgi:hypothetical protein